MPAFKLIPLSRAPARRRAAINIALALAALLMSALPVWAQTTQPGESAATQPDTQPAATEPSVVEMPATHPATEPTTQPQTMPATQPTTAPATQASAGIAPNHNGNGGIHTESNGLVLNFRDANIDVVLDELSSAGGLIIVKEVKPQGRITLTSRQPVSREEIGSLLNTVLFSAGYGAVQQGRVLKIVARDQIKHLSIPVRMGSDPTRIEPTDEMITQVIPLRYADAAQLQKDLAPLINPEADFTSNASSNALLITDTAANVRRVVQIINALDTSMADAVDVKIFQLKYANATNAAQLVNSVFSNLEVAGGAPGGPQPPGNGPGAGFRRFQQMQQQAQQQAQQGVRGAHVNAAADERTNSVVVTGPVDTLASVERIIKELDANPISDETVFVYRLKNGQSANLESVINTLFGNTTGGRPAGTQSQLGSQRTTTGSRTVGGSTVSSSSIGNRTVGGNTNTNQNRYGNQQQAAARVSPGAQQTAAALAGQVTIISDPDTNSLLVRTSPANYDRVKSVLDELDRPVAQVLIKVLIAEVTHDDTIDLGAEFSALNIAATSTNTFNAHVNGANAGVSVNIINADFSVNIRALEAQGKLDVLSRPYILASDNQLASITVGQEVPFITNSRITDAGQTINTIQYSDIGILLDVVPHINPDGLVILDIAPEISTLTSDSVPISNGVTAPVIAKRSAQSRVGVRSGQTVVIGGLMEDRLTDRLSKVPLLGDIPLIGGLFRRTTKDKSKTELLIFLTPHVAFQPEQLEGMSKQEMNGVKLTPHAVAPGTFNEQIKGMQSGEATQPAPEQVIEPAPEMPEPPADPATEKAIEP